MTATDEKKLKYWLGLIAVICVLIAMSVVIIGRKKQALLQREMNDARNDLIFVSHHIHTHLQNNDYEALEPYLQDWARYHSERIAELKLTVANGFVITHIVQDSLPARIYKTSENIPYSYDNQALLEMTAELASVDEAIINDIKALGLIIFLSVAAMGFILWLALKRHSAAVALQLQSEELNKLSIAIEQSPVAIIMTDIDGTIEYVNPRFSDHTGYTMDDVIGQNPQIFKSGVTTDEEYGDLWETILDGKIWRGEFLNVRKNGDQYWENATIGPVRNEDGVITHFIAFKEDITEQKSLREQLLQAQKLEGIGKLAGGIAHDFNNFLSVISGHTELALLDVDMNESVHSDLVQISKAAKNAALLTRQLLMFSRRQVIEPKIIDLNALITNMNSMIKRIIGEDITITLDLDSDICPVKADSGQLEQIFMNLIINAKDALNLKASSADGKKITVETSGLYLDADYVSMHVGSNIGPHVLVAFSDNGIGMDAGTREKVFEPFFTTKEHGRGTGLGLSMVYGIVKQNNGIISVYSEPGLGTTFKILWPCEVDAKLSELPGVDEAKTRGSDETVLVVEDDEDVCEMACTSLKRYGYDILKASGGRQAMEIARSGKKIDLLLTDVVMPGMGGPELAGELKKIVPGLKIIFCSGYTDNHILNREIVEERAHFIQKPYAPGALARKVRAVLDED
jgi:PAS domain S-box-containing protein